MTQLNQLLTDIENTSKHLTESSNSKVISKLKKNIREYAQSTTVGKFIETLPTIINHIKNFFSGKNVKLLLVFILKVSLVVGISVSNIKEIYSNSGVSDYIEWSEFKEQNSEISNISHTFDIGEYVIDDTEFNRFIEFFESNLTKGDTVTITGDVIVSISDEGNERINYANDDTPTDKEKGGQLIEKRAQYSKLFITRLEKELNNKGYSVDFKVDYENAIPNTDDGKYLKIDNIKILKEETTKVDIKNTDANIEQDDIDQEIGDIALSGGGGDPTPDIKGLSKNYQYVELLKLGGIETDRVQGDNRSSGYSDWIVDTRKHPKRLLRRLQREYPEYNITFNMDSKSKNPVVGAKKGMSNIRNQYQEVSEKRSVFNFNDFVNENNGDDTLLRVWRKILGNKFNTLTQEQAEMFDKNIEKVLDYLEQMYGSSAIEFKYNVV